jgi:hypothetical protein
MKKLILVVISLFFINSASCADPSGEIELGTVGPLTTFYSPSSDLYEAMITGSSKAKEEISPTKLGVTLVFQRTYTKGSKEAPTLMLQVRTRGSFYANANPIRVEIITAGSAKNVTLYPTAILGSESGGTYYSTIDYPIGETHNIADAFRSGTIRSLNLSYQLPNKTRQIQGLVLSDALKAELKKLGNLDLTKPDTFEAIIPI